MNNCSKTVIRDVLKIIRNLGKMLGRKCFTKCFGTNFEIIQCVWEVRKFLESVENVQHGNIKTLNINIKTKISEIFNTEKKVWNTLENKNNYEI